MAKKTKDQRVLKLMLSEDKGRSSSRERTLEKLAERLEARIGSMEGELTSLKKTLDEQSQTLKKPPQASEIQHLTQLIERKILKVADQFSPEKHVLESPVTYFISEQLKKLAHAVTLESFRNMLVSIWYLGRPRDSEVDEFGMDREFSRRAKPFFDFLYYNYWRVSVKGIHHIHDKGRGLIVSNHSGTVPYDGSMIRLASENEGPAHRDIRFLVEDFVYHFPFLGTFMYRTGGVRACQENAARLLETDHIVTVFPEGIKGIGKLYKNRYRLQRFGRGGFIRLALRTGSPIIPAAVIGAEEIYPLLHKSTFMAKALGVPYIPITPTFPLLGLLGLIPLPSKWTIIFGKPISWKQYGPKHAEDRLLVNRLSEEVRLKIQEMVFEGLAARRSIWFG